MYADLEQKVCSSCKQVKEKKEFHADRTAKSGIRSQCRSCKYEKEKIWAAKNVEKRKFKEFKRGLRRFYGLTIEQYNQMFLEQDGCCKICRISQSLLNRRLAVDHCHETNKIRGLLCDNCNPMIGYAKDNTEVLAAAIAYLNKFKK